MIFTYYHLQFGKITIETAEVLDVRLKKVECDPKIFESALREPLFQMFALVERAEEPCLSRGAARQAFNIGLDEFSACFGLAFPPKVS